MIPPAHAPAFLAAHGWGDAQILPLAGDASFRRYFRVVDGERQAVLMDAPPPHEDPRPFIAVAEYLCDQGLNAPTILARDLDRGLLLIEDFGDVRLRETVDAAPHTEADYYEGVTDLLVHLHARTPMAGLPVHGIGQWLDEVMLFADWYCPALDIAVDRDAFRSAWEAALMPVEKDGLPRVTVLRDYHAENIMLVPGQDGIAHYGLLDFQDALQASHVDHGAAIVAIDLGRRMHGARRPHRRGEVLLVGQDGDQVVDTLGRDEYGGTIGPGAVPAWNRYVAADFHGPSLMLCRRTLAQFQARAQPRGEAPPTASMLCNGRSWKGWGR